MSLTECMRFEWEIARVPKSMGESASASVSQIKKYVVV